MDVQIVSDLHLEAPKAYDFFEIVPAAPVLALLGDIGNVKPHQADLATFLLRQLHQFEAVLFVLGNHETYHASWRETLSILTSLEKEFASKKETESGLGTFVLLNRGTYRLPHSPGTVVLGCSLFSHIPPSKEMSVSMGVNDFFQTEDDPSFAPWNVAAHNSAHARDLAWLNETVAELERPASADVQSLLIMTHWSPSTDARTVDPRHTNSPIGSGFGTELSNERCFQSPKLKVWAFGHTHYNCDVLVERAGGSGPLRLVTNQRGYYFQQAEGYDNGKTVQG